MANIRVATRARNAALKAILDLINLGSGSGTLKVYTGVQPANGDASAAGTLLGTLTFSDPAAPDPDAGMITFSAIAEDPDTDAGGTATWARILDSDANHIFDGDVGTSNAMIVLNRTDIAPGGPLRITSFSVVFPTSITF